MHAQIEKLIENKSRTAANSAAQKNSNVKQWLGFADNRPETVTQRKMQENASLNIFRTIQRAAGDEHAGSIQVKLSDGSTSIFVDDAIRPWFDLPSNSGMILGDTVTFTEGANRAVTNLVRTGHVQTAEERLQAVEAARANSIVVYDHGNGETLTEYDIEHGTWQRLIGDGRPATDYELVTQLGGVIYSYHFHAPPFEGRRPTPGQVMRSGQMTNIQTPTDVLDAVMRLRGRPNGY